MHITPLKFAFLLLFASIILWVAGSMNGGLPCSVVHRTETVNGSSLAGFAEHGDLARIAYGYYACGELRRDDIVVYRDSGNGNPLIKIAKAVPGDSFMLALSEGGAKIFINGVVAKTTTGEAYRISEDGYRMLSLYERDYKGVIPSGALLVLGNLPGGSRDSTQFGLASRENLLGKVIEILPSR